MSQLHVLTKKYTYEDYLTFDDDFRCEIIEGEIYEMAPAPNWEHQDISTVIFTRLSVYLGANRGQARIFSAPFDVRLFSDTVVQPDIVVILDKSRKHPRGLMGAPDIAVEILSNSTSAKDLGIKHRKYLEAGTPEYWIIDPKNRQTKICYLQDNQYAEVIFGEEDEIVSKVLPGFRIKPKEFFPID